MWTEESYPEYYYEDPDYEDAENLSEVRALRLLKTYHDLVSQRYTTALTFPYKNYKKNQQGRFLKLQGERYFEALKYIGDRLGDRDPAYFMSFIFEIWENRKYNHIFKRLGWELHSGVQFPSITGVMNNKEELVSLFMGKENYKPQEFIPHDEHLKRRKEAINNRVMRWCMAYDKVPFEFWKAHLNPNLMTVREIDCADSFWELDEQFRKEFGASAQEVRDGLEKLERRLERKERRKYKQMQKLRQEGKTPELTHLTVIPNDEFLDEYAQKAVAYYTKALEEGRDVLTEEFEQEVEEILNPIDYDHPDTVMYYYYGVGNGPRRKYSSENE